MAELKREYVVPLRRKCKLAPRWRRSKKAIAVLKDFMRKHMKCENVIVCAELNEHIWANGAKNPPGKVEVIALRTQVGSDEKVLVNLKSVGVDSQQSMYAQETQTQAAPVANEEVVEADVKEKESEEKSEKSADIVEEETTTKKTTKKATKTVVEKKDE